MDDALFLDWIAGTSKLTPLQRQHAFRALALAEAAAVEDERVDARVTTDAPACFGREHWDFCGIGGTSRASAVMLIRVVGGGRDRARSGNGDGMPALWQS